MESTDIIIKIRKIVRSINLESKKIEKEYGVSIPQVLCLNYLYAQQNFQAGQGEIKKFLNLNASTVSGIINRLEAKGLVARLPKSGDRRIVTISLTSKGDKLLNKIPALLQDKLAEKLGKLGHDELIVVHDSLDLLIGILDIEDLEAYPPVSPETQEFPGE